MSKKYMAAGLALFVLLLNPLALKGLEAGMATYMLVHVPGLVAGGYFIGKSVSPRIPADLGGFNPMGVPGLLAAVFTITYWILPRSVDAAINETTYEIIKLITLPVLAGIPLAISWPKLSSIGKGFVWANLIAMLFVMGWLYLSAPVRLCNNFLVWQQELLGKLMLVAGGVLAIYFVLQAFIGNQSAHDSEKVVEADGETMGSVPV